jgi:hypothetical protein
MNKRTHIIKRVDGWVVKNEGSRRAYRKFPTQNEALLAAKQLKSLNDIIVHRKDGSIKEWIRR